MQLRFPRYLCFPSLPLLNHLIDFHDVRIPKILRLPQNSIVSFSNNNVTETQSSEAVATLVLLTLGS